MTTFTTFNLPSSLEKSLKAMNYEKPTDIQSRAIPICMSGKDLLASAQTGTGKTGAFAIPLVAKILNDPSQKALIMAPTRELAEQVFQVIMDMVRGQRQIGVVLLIGGVPIFKQFSRLRDNPQIIIGTPGRIYDHITRGKNAPSHHSKLDVSDVSLLILDEADRMLDMGFGDQLEAIVKEMPTERQTLMFSATFPKGIKQISQRYLKDPERIDVGVKHQLNTNLTHESIFVEGRAKYGKLIEAINQLEGTIIVFANTKRMCDQLTDMLCEEGIHAIAMHGDLKQSQRTRVIAGFRSKRYKVLIATDVAARGLDIPHVETVINYDLPMSPEDYIHRVGRTARAGAKGHALDLVSSVDKAKLAIIKRLLQGEDMDFIKQMNKRSSGSGRGGERRSYGGESRGGERRSYGGDSRGGERRSFGGGDDRRGGGERRSFGDRDRPSADRGGERRSFGDRDRPSADRGGERRSFGDRDRPSADRGGERRSFGDRPSGERKPFGERKSFGDRPSGERKPFGERKSFGDRPAGERKPFGERKSFGDRPAGERKPFGERKSFGDRPGGERKPFGERKAFGDRPAGERKPFGDRKKPGAAKAGREPRFPEEFVISQ